MKHKVKNFFSICVAINIILITTFFILSKSIDNSRLIAIEDSSGKAHLAVDDIDKSEVDGIRRDFDIESIYEYQYFDGNKNLEDKALTVISTNDDFINVKGVAFIKGEFPQNDDDVMLEKWVYDNLKKYIHGDVIELDLLEHGKKSFKISGIIEDIGLNKRLAIKIRVAILKHISELSGRYYTDKKTGDILSVVQSDIDIIERIDAELAFSIVKNFATAVVALYFLISIQVELFVFVALLQIVLVLIQRKFTKSIHENVSKIRKEYGEITNLIQEYVLNIMSIVISKSRRFFIKDYIKREKNLIQKDIKTDMLYKGNITVAMLINSVITLAIYGYGGYKVITDNLTLGSLLAFQSYSAMLLGPCISIVNANNRLQQAKVSIDRVYNLLDEGSEVENNNSGKILKKCDIESIIFKNVGFSYDEDSYLSSKYKVLQQKSVVGLKKGNNPINSCEKMSIEVRKNILNDLNLKFDKGMVTALVGSSGCGDNAIMMIVQ